MSETLKRCVLDGNSMSRVVFEPVNLAPSEIVRLFDSIRDKKFLEILNGLSPEISELRGKLILSDYGVMAVCFHVEEDVSKIFVIVKVIGVEGNFLLAYEFSNDSFSIFLEKNGEVEVLKLHACSMCAKTSFPAVCWTFPIYALFPTLYPDLCDGEFCRKTLLT